MPTEPRNTRSRTYVGNVFDKISSELSDALPTRNRKCPNTAECLRGARLGNNESDDQVGELSNNDVEAERLAVAADAQASEADEEEEEEPEPEATLTNRGIG